MWGMHPACLFFSYHRKLETQEAHRKLEAYATWKLTPRGSSRHLNRSQFTMEKFSGASTWLGIVLALIAGCVMALQPMVNGRLAGQCGHPLQASIISFGTGLLALLLVGVSMRVGYPVSSKLQTLPMWAWTGGLLGTYMVTVSLLVAPRLGATRWLALVLAGQIALSLVLDHFGAGYAQHAISPLRLLGVLCVVAGVYLVMRN